MHAAPPGQYPHRVRTVALVTLGCARNDVDSDELATNLTDAGYTVTTDETSADVIMVNTCGFVSEAKQESIDALLSAGTDGRPVIAVGCLAERYGRDLAGALPEVAAVVGFDGYPTVGRTIERVLAGESIESHVPTDRRTLLPVTPVERPGRSQPPGHAPTTDLPGIRRLRLRRRRKKSRDALNGGPWPPFCYKITAVCETWPGPILCGSWLACDTDAAV